MYYNGGATVTTMTGWVFVLKFPVIAQGPVST